MSPTILDSLKLLLWPSAPENLLCTTNLFHIGPRRVPTVVVGSAEELFGVDQGEGVQCGRQELVC